MNKKFPLYAGLGATVLLFTVLLTIASPSFTTTTMLLLTAVWTIFASYKLQLFSNSTTGQLDSGISRSAQKEHQLLLESIHHYPMPFALYDENDQLCVWNKHYENIYQRAFEKLENSNDAKTLSYEDLVRSNVEDDLSAEELEDYVGKRVADQRITGGDITDRHYAGHGWYRVSKYNTPSGGVAGFAIDINELKQRETDLLTEVERRKKLEVEIRSIANTDFLTGIPNRRHFIERANTDFLTSQSTHSKLSILMIDIDLFKSVNDSCGHLIGDEVLSTIASTISNILHGVKGFVGRLGGEEFAALLPNHSLVAAHNIAESIRSSIEEISFVSEGTTFFVTVSIGVAERESSDDHFSNLMKRSDDALYNAKCNGRNRVVVDDSGPSKLLHSSA